MSSNEGGGIRIPKRVGYSVFTNDMLPENFSLSARAWGLYIYLSTRPEGWVIRVPHLQKVFTEGRDAIYTALHELVDQGLMVKETYQDNGVPRQRHVLAVPDVRPGDSPNPDFQDSGNQDSGNPETLVTTDSQSGGSPSLSPSPNEMDEAEQVASTLLGATPEDERERANTGEHLRHREVAIRKAQTERPRSLWAEFNPEAAGYLRTDFKREFPLLDWDTVVARFVDFYLDKAPKSNWMVTFFAYATEAHRRAAAERDATGVLKDSMGLPLDPARRRAGDTPEARQERLEAYKQTEQRFAALEEGENE